jgi:hypothetical protein
VNLDRYRKDLDRLATEGDKLNLALLIEVYPKGAKTGKLTKEQIAELPRFGDEYQAWYSEALAVVRQLLPDRLNDFISYYKPLKPRKELNAATYTISDLLQGLTASRGGEPVVGFNAALLPMEQQVNIIKALKRRFDSSLFDIRALVQADLLDSELEAAEELNSKGFHRGAGAVAGVVLESHLATVCEQHEIAAGKNPSISELNDILRKHNVLDLPTWRFVQHLGDIRNLCDHKKEAEPTKEQIHELIQGVLKIIKTVF